MMNLLLAVIYFALIGSALALLGFGVARFARAMGEESFWPWFWFGCVASVVAVIVIVTRASSRRKVAAGATPASVSGSLAGASMPTGQPRATGKRCPDCAEGVQAAARVCKHCGYRFSSEQESA